MMLLSSIKQIFIYALLIQQQISISICTISYSFQFCNSLFIINTFVCYFIFGVATGSQSLFTSGHLKRSAKLLCHRLFHIQVATVATVTTPIYYI